MQQYAVVFFPKIDRKSLQAFRKKYDPNLRIISPHITIISPVSNISESQLIQHVENVTKDIAPFSIHLTGLTKTFDDCLFLLVKEGNEKIMNLHDRLYSGILTPYIPTYLPFIPHITLGDFSTKDGRFDKKRYERAYIEVQKLNIDINCEFNSLSVIKGDGVTPAEIVKTIILQC